MKILISAYACEPGAGSEAGAGWEWTKAAAAEHEIWLITRIKNRGPILAASKAAGLNIRVIGLDLPRFLRFWKRGHRGRRAYYLLWQILAARTIRRLIERQPLSLSHHLTFASDSLPPGAILAAGIPSIWGPIGGYARHSFWPSLRWLGIRGLVSELARLPTSAAFRVTFGRMAARKSTLVLAQNPDVAVKIRAAEVKVYPNIILDSAEIHEMRSKAREEQQNDILFVGRLLPSKGLLLAIRAFALLPQKTTVLHIYGDGPDRRRAEQLTTRLGIESRTVFHGARPRHVVLCHLAAAGCFVSPSFHDSAGWAVAESLSLGTAVVCLDVAGPGYIMKDVDGLSGIAICPRSARLASRLSEGIAAWHGRPVPYDDRFLSSRRSQTISGIYTSARNMQSSSDSCGHEV